MHEHHSTTLAILFTTANAIIAVGYLAVPLLVLRYLPLSRVVLCWGAIFFMGCSGTHLGMAMSLHDNPGLFWTVEHIIQAFGTWGFIITFTRMLRAASARRTPQTGGGGQR